MREKTYVASCPICGRTLFKGMPNSYIEGGCPKCKNYLMITFVATGVQATVTELKLDDGFGPHT
jgi:phage FluMu protein Com